MRKHPIGIYEKALPKNSSWLEKLVIANLRVMILWKCQWMKLTNA